MQASRTDNNLILELGLLEKQVLLHIFTSVISNYRLKPEEMHPKVAAAWYSTRGCKSAGMTAEETGEWIESLREYKSANLALLEKWVAAMSEKPADPFILKLPVEQAHVLLSIINDHRLLAAAESEIGDEEMELHSLNEFEELPADKQAALYEIHFLAWLMEEILRLAAPEAASWNAAKDKT
jgi:hypothetical protein